MTLLDLISRVFGGPFTAKPSSPAHPMASPTNVVRPATVRPTAIRHQYPARDEGLDASLTVEELLHPHQALIKKIRLASGANGNFENYYLPAIRDLANWVHALPAAESGNHIGAGGLLNLCLDLGFHTLQVADQNLFARSEPVERRMAIEQRWLLSAFLAGLYSELHVIPSRMDITTEKGTVWPCLIMGLKPFLDQEGVDRYFVRFKPVTHPSRDGSSLIAQRLLPTETMSWLHSGHPGILPTLLAAISGHPLGDDSKMVDILTRMREKVVAIDVAAQPANYGKLKVGVHLEPYFIDGMRTLVCDGTWKLNQPKSRLWYGKDGLFIFWKSAYKELLQHLHKVGVSGIPEQPETVAEILMQVKFIEPTPEGRVFWQIHAPGSDNVFDGVKVTNPIALLGEITEEIKGVILKTNIGVKNPLSDPKKRNKKNSAQEGLFDEDLAQAGAALEDSKSEKDTNEAASEPEITDPITEGQPTDQSAPPAQGTPRAAPPQDEDPSDGDLFSPNDGIVCIDAPPSANVAAPSKQADPVSRDTEPSDVTPSTKTFIPAEDSSSSEITLAGRVQPVEETLPEGAERLLSQVADLVSRDALRGILIDLKNGNLKESVKAPNGTGIFRDVLSNYGIQEDAFLMAMETVGWRARDPAKPSAKYHKLKIGDQAVMAYLFKDVIAKGLDIKVYHDLSN